MKISVCVLNIHYRGPSTHDMPKWLRKTFLQVLPKFIFVNKKLNFTVETDPHHETRRLRFNFSKDHTFCFSSDFDYTFKKNLYEPSKVRCMMTQTETTPARL